MRPIFCLTAISLALLAAVPAARATDGHLLLCEGVLKYSVTGQSGEFIEIVNPTNGLLPLTNHYLSDNKSYALVPGGLPPLHGSDFIARFPDGAGVPANETRVVAVDGAGYVALYGQQADFELKGTHGDTPDMVDVKIGGSVSLTDAGEGVVLFYWNGTSDLVQDVDMVNLGLPDEGNAIGDKTGVAVDGPDADGLPSVYQPDAFRMPLQSHKPGFGESTKRVTLEGGAEFGGSGNGPNGDDETSEDILATWDSLYDFTLPTPGYCCLTVDCYYDGLNASSGGALRAGLGELIKDHKYFRYTADPPSTVIDTWDILELADEDPLDPSHIRDLYKNASYPKYATGNDDYQREHSWPKSYGFKEETKDAAGDSSKQNYPYTDCHHLILADGPYNGTRSNKPYRNCLSCTEKPTVFGDGRGGGGGFYPGDSNWTTSETGPAGSWETWPHRRGDVARALFYMDVRYTGGTHVDGSMEPNLHLTNTQASIVSSGTNLTVGYMGFLADLLQWHVEDPADLDELLRNEMVFRFQRNRNPFIDHPEWAHCVFDDNCYAAQPCDLEVTNDGWVSALPGETAVYTITAANQGPNPAPGARVSDAFDPTGFDLASLTWTCVPAPGSDFGTTCPASGGAIELADGVSVDLQSGDSVEFTVQAPVLGAATGSAVATARMAAALPGTDPLLASNIDRCTTNFLTAGGCGSPDAWDLSGREVAETRTFEACTALSAGNFMVLPTGDATFRAGVEIRLGNGFSVHGNFKAEIDPSLGP